MILEKVTFGIETNTNELKLNQADDLVNEMYREYCKYSKLLELATKDRIEVIKDYVRYLVCNEQTFKNAQKWLTMKENADKRRKYEEKEDFEYLENKLKEIFNSNIKITQLSFMGLENYAYIIDFLCEGNDTVFELTIPRIEMLCEKWWAYMHGGKLSLHYHKSESILDYMCESYKEEDIKKALKDFLMFGNNKIKMMEC